MCVCVFVHAVAVPIFVETVEAGLAFLLFAYLWCHRVPPTFYYCLALGVHREPLVDYAATCSFILLAVFCVSLRWCGLHFSFLFCVQPPLLVCYIHCVCTVCKRDTHIQRGIERERDGSFRLFLVLFFSVVR